MSLDWRLHFHSTLAHACKQNITRVYKSLKCTLLGYQVFAFASSTAISPDLTASAKQHGSLQAILLRGENVAPMPLIVVLATSKELGLLLNFIERYAERVAVNADTQQNYDVALCFAAYGGHEGMLHSAN